MRSGTLLGNQVMWIMRPDEGQDEQHHNQEYDKSEQLSISNAVLQVIHPIVQFIPVANNRDLGATSAGHRLFHGSHGPVQLDILDVHMYGMMIETEDRRQRATEH